MPAAPPPDPADRIVRLKLSEQVLDRLRAMIVSGELKAGDKMPSERALMARFGVGRPAVREALQSLQNQGLITITHGERSRVNEISALTVLDQSDDVARLLLEAAPANLEHLKEARRMFEVGIVRAAARKAGPKDIAHLRALVERQRGQLPSVGDTSGFIEADMRFHTAIAELLGNPVITAASRAMLRWLLEYHASLLYRSDREHVTLAEHSGIVDAMEAGDAEAAAARMEAHLERAQPLFAPRPTGA